MKLQLSGTEQITAPGAAVRTFLLSPEQVGRCMPDLQELRVPDERHAVAIVKLGLGPIRGTFKLEVELPPADGDEIHLKMKGSGMGNGLTLTAVMRTSETGPGATELAWSADAAVSGPLAGLGGRLLEGQARKTTELLFANIRQALAQTGIAAG